MSFPGWQRTVDKSQAMKMSVIVYYNGYEIISYNPSTPQWWLTAFNPNYLNVNADDLNVAYSVIFNSRDMYYAFREGVKKSDFTCYMFFPWCNGVIIWF